MKRKYQIKKNKQFRKIYSEGTSLANRYAVLFALENKLALKRFGFSVSKKLGKAVKRNLIKRRMKEICRLYGYNLNNGYDYVFIARKGIEKLDFATTNEIMENLVYRINKRFKRKS